MRSNVVERMLSKSSEVTMCTVLNGRYSLLTVNNRPISVNGKH